MMDAFDRVHQIMSLNQDYVPCRHSKWEIPHQQWQYYFQDQDLRLSENPHAKQGCMGPRQSVILGWKMFRLSWEVTNLCFGYSCSWCIVGTRIVALTLLHNVFNVHLLCLSEQRNKRSQSNTSFPHTKHEHSPKPRQQDDWCLLECRRDTQAASLSLASLRQFWSC